MKKIKLNKKYLIVIILLILVAVFLCLIILNVRNKDKVCFDRTCFRAEKAISPQEKETGLMNRTHLKDNYGMIFIFEREDIYSFWMKDTLIPLDMIWINSSNNVVFIKKNAMPCTSICIPIVPDKNATYVLEINAGLTDKYNITIGENVKIY